MSRPRLILSLAFVSALAAAARPLSACMIVGPSVQRGPNQTLLMVVPAADSVYVGRAGRLDRVRLGAWLHPRDFARRTGAWRRVYGQRVRMVRAGWSVADGLAGRFRSGAGEAVVVPWSSSNCSPVAWREPALWMRPGGRVVLMATLRPRRAWIGGVPTFDAYRVGREPYPTDPGWSYAARHEKAAGPWLTLEEYWSLAETFPVYGRNGADFRAFDRWLARNPALARRFPAPLFVRSALSIRALAAGPGSPGGS